MAGKLRQILESVHSHDISVKDAHTAILELELLRGWINIDNASPEEFEPIIGLCLPWEGKCVCHREGDVYISEETGEEVDITHWVYYPEIAPF